MRNHYITAILLSSLSMINAPSEAQTRTEITEGRGLRVRQIVQQNSVPMPYVSPFARADHQAQSGDTHERQEQTNEAPATQPLEKPPTPIQAIQSQTEDVGTGGVATIEQNAQALVDMARAAQPNEQEPKRYLSDSDAQTLLSKIQNALTLTSHEASSLVDRLNADPDNAQAREDLDAIWLKLNTLDAQYALLNTIIGRSATQNNSNQGRELNRKHKGL